MSLASSTERSCTIRHATSADLDAVSVLAAELVREHHAYDARRFLITDRLEEGYRWFLSRELEDPASVVIVATDAGSLVGYAYGRMEPRNWVELREACGALHDIYVAERARRRGIAAALLARMNDELRSRGAPRIVLSTARQNVAAQRLFEKVGFRVTMYEMTRELDDG